MFSGRLTVNGCVRPGLGACVSGASGRASLQHKTLRIVETYTYVYHFEDNRIGVHVHAFKQECVFIT